MIRLRIYDTGKIKIDKNLKKSDYDGWFINKFVGGYYYGGKESYEAILFDGDKNNPSIRRKITSIVKGIDKDIAKLQKQKENLLQTKETLLQAIDQAFVV